MPFINRKFYMNPAYGRAIEYARRGGAVPNSQAAQQGQDHGRDDQDGHWVTISGNHVLIDEAKQERAPNKPTKTGGLSARDKSYLDKYYGPVSALAKRYGVDPALVLGLGIESGFASEGTYLRTGDAFGMTGGNTKHMTTAKSPTENVKQFFDNYGEQIRGTGSDSSAFINGLQGRDASGEDVKGWKVYNTVQPDWEDRIGRGIGQMRRGLPHYLSKPGANQVAQ